MKTDAGHPRNRKSASDWPFFASFAVLGGTYVALIVAMILADISFTSPRHIREALASPEIRYAIRLSLISCSITALLSLLVAVPLGYLMARRDFRGRSFIDAVLDVPIVLPPLVIGLSLLILFQLKFGGVSLESLLTRLGLPITYQVPAVILAQFSVSAAFAVRTMRVTFEQINPRTEQVALTLGCNRAQAFWHVALPEARRGVLAAATLAWARALGEFGPVLVFAGATRMRTEVLSTSVFLELSVGKIEAAVAVSLLMIIAAAAVLGLLRMFGTENNTRSSARP